MFGAIAASRPVITEFQTISPTQFAFNIPSQPAFSHIVVFLLPGNVLEAGTAAAVYIQIPPSAEFKLLGAIANEKQSAIFKVNTGAAGGGSASNISSAAQGDDVMIDEDTSLPVITGQGVVGGPNIVIGISIEPAASIEAQLAALKSGSNNNNPKNNNNNNNQQQQQQPQQSQQTLSTKILAQRIIKNAFNFLSSFATAGSSGSGETVPLKALQDWWTKFESRLDRDPSFLERDEQS